MFLLNQITLFLLNAMNFIYVFVKELLFLLNVINFFFCLEMKSMYIIYIGKKKKMNVLNFCC